MDETELTARSVGVVTGVVQDVKTVAEGSRGAIWTYVSVVPEDVIAGDLPAGVLTLREAGGEVAGRGERIFGEPTYSVGEKVLVFVSQAADGSLHTTGMAMGKYRLARNLDGTTSAARDFSGDVTVLRRRGGRLTAGPTGDRLGLDDIVARVRSARTSLPRAPITTRPLETGPREYVSSFTLFATPARWFEPDDGQPIAYAIDATGDQKMGPDATRAAVDEAFAAWSTIGSASLTLVDGGTIPSMPFSGCDGGNRILFNDPYGEITDPTNCGGILAIGGYCTVPDTEVVNGTTFRRIVVGKVMFNNGWEQCPGWNACNLAEVAVHEIGHTIGFGHSGDYDATMFGTAHFDGRCAGLKWDDIDAAQAVYPRAGAVLLVSPTPTRTATVFRTPTRTLSPSPTRTPTRTSTPTLFRTSTRTRTRTPTTTRTATPLPTRTATATRTPTVVRTATRTLTRTPTPLATRTRTPTVTRVPTRTPTRTWTAVRTRTPTPTRTQTRTRTATPTRPPTRTWTPTRTRTPTRSRTSTPTRTRTRTGTPTRTPTRTLTPAALTHAEFGDLSPGWVDRLIAAWGAFTRH